MRCLGFGVTIAWHFVCVLVGLQVHVYVQRVRETRERKGHGAPPSTGTHGFLGRMRGTSGLERV
jgi:hypothetical protein